MKFDNIAVYNFKNALHGMRNPKDSWHLSDSEFGYEIFDNLPDVICDAIDVYYTDEEYNALSKEEQEKLYDYWKNNAILNVDKQTAIGEYAIIGPKDMKLAQTLIKSGPEHRKFLRQIFVSVDITAPLFWWKEFDTYKVGTVANSTSTMHKLTAYPITMDCFEHDDYDNQLLVPYESDERLTEAGKEAGHISHWHMEGYWDYTIIHLEDLRLAVNAETDPARKKKLWKELVRALPESWLQTRTVTMSYENLLAICSKSQRRFHKLTEWSGDGEDFATPSFIKFARTLPYAQEFIFIDELENN